MTHSVSLALSLAAVRKAHSITSSAIESTPGGTADVAERGAPFAY